MGLHKREPSHDDAREGTRASRRVAGARAWGARRGRAVTHRGYARAAADLVVCLGSLLAFSCTVVWYQIGENVGKPYLIHL